MSKARLLEENSAELMVVEILNVLRLGYHHCHC